MTEIIKVSSYAKGITHANRKVGLVASLVRNRTVADALVILSHTPKRAALPVIKAIESIKSNAINTHGLNSKTLFISTISVTSGTRLKRYMPASRGRALQFEKKTSNILIELSGEMKPIKKPVTKPAEKKESNNGE
jgi:large subunit ribosomal protein L22